MGREARRNEENRELARKMRDDALQAFCQSFCILTNSLAVSVVVTEHTGTYTGGIPNGQTRMFTVSHATPEIGQAHMLQGSELLHQAHQRLEADLAERRNKARQDEAAALATPEGMEDDEPVGPSGIQDLVEAEPMDKEKLQEAGESVGIEDTGRSAPRPEGVHEETCMSLRGGVCDC